MADRCGRFPDPYTTPDWWYGPSGTRLPTCDREAGHEPPHEASRDGHVYVWGDPPGVREANELEGVSVRAERVPDWQWPTPVREPSYVVERYGPVHSFQRMGRWAWFWLCVKHPRAWLRGRRG